METRHTITEALDRFQLVSGAGDGERTACAMSLLNWVCYNSERGWTDAPECSHPLIRAQVIEANDATGATPEDRAELVRAGETGILDTWWVPTRVIVAGLAYERDAEQPTHYDRTMAMLRHVSAWKLDKAKPDLTGANLTGAVLTGAILAGANLRGAYLMGAILAGANLADAILAGANFTGADLRGANFADANLTGANFTGANLTGAILTDADLTHAMIAMKPTRNPSLRSRSDGNRHPLGTGHRLRPRHRRPGAAAGPRRHRLAAYPFGAHQGAYSAQRRPTGRTAGQDPLRLAGGDSRLRGAGREGRSGA